jgi:hypothetical protein
MFKKSCETVYSLSALVLKRIGTKKSPITYRTLFNLQLNPIDMKTVKL